MKKTSGERAVSTGFRIFNFCGMAMGNRANRIGVSAPKRKDVMRKRKGLLPVAIAGIGLFGAAADAGLPPAHPGPTVNDYTAAQSAHAEAAAREAGFDQLEITMVQAGNFFLKGEKAGQSYLLTVSPEGKVYSSAPSSAPPDSRQ